MRSREPHLAPIMAGMDAGGGDLARPDAAGTQERFVPALGLHWLTPLYDGLLRIGGLEGVFKDRVIEWAAIQPGESVLDLGCGTGTLAIQVKQREPAAKVLGLDGDPAMLSRARSKARCRGASIRFDQGLSWNLPYPTASLDVILSTLFFHHLDRIGRSRTLAEVVRVLRPGGRLHLADWGRQGTMLMKVLSFPDRLLDGLGRTADASAGRLPGEMMSAGLVNVAETGTLDSAFGRLTFYTARNPE